MSTINQINKNSKDSHNIKTYLSFGVLLLGLNGMQFAVAQNYLTYYQIRLGLDIWLIVFASIFYTIWDMFNDPFVGHLSDRNTRFTKRWGKRFPWLSVSTFGIVFGVILFFSAPNVSVAGSWLTFLWFLIFFSVYDGLYSAIFVNYKALLPNKFKSKEARINASSISQLFLLLGPIIGLIVAPTLLTDDPQSYSIMAIFLAFVMLFSYILSIYGLKEDDELKQTYFREKLDSSSFLTDFIGNLKQSYHERSFNIFAFYIFAMALATALMAVSVPMYVEFILEEEIEFQRIVNAPFVMTSLLLLPLYFWIIKRIGHLKAFKYGLALTSIPFFLMFLSFWFMPNDNLPIVMVGAALWGILGSIAVIAAVPVQSDFFDESAVKYQKRQEGMYSGNWNFYARLITVVQLGLIALIQTLTGFDNQANTQTELAKWGIMIHFTLIPAIVLLTASLVIWKYWYLTPEVMEPIKNKLEEIGL